MKAKESKNTRKKHGKINLTVVVVVLILTCVFFGKVKDIVELKAENERLIEQQEELKKKRDLLKAKLKNIDNKDFIQEEARKQLKMMDPDEILYVFEDED
ncbi:MAG: septum formation initiator family protein [Firmicutes bacterium]|nr:septum formation initiator family protein [Bacillota bacterium]